MFLFPYFSAIIQEFDSKQKPETSRTLNTENWVDDHGDYLYNIALFRVGNTQMAEDIVQDTFMAALKGIDSFEGKSSERTWLVSILKRKIIDYYRKNRRFVFLSQDGDMEELPDFHSTGTMKGSWKAEYTPESWIENPLESIERREFQDILQKCIQNLPENLSAVFTIREIEGWPTEKICKDFEISPSNLWVMLHRARMRMRRCLERKWFSSNS